jgi:hypothetical protein
LNESARGMFKASTALKRRACWGLVSCYLIAGAVILILIIAIIFSLNYSVFHWW